MNLHWLRASLLPAAFLFAVEVGAQNARIEALGGNFIIDDLSMMSGAPACGNYYGNFVQASAWSDSLAGSVYAMTSLGGWAKAGIIANQEGYLLGDFYGEARSGLDSTLALVDSLPDRFGMYPHLVFATELAGVGFGCELFFERSSLSREWTNAIGVLESQKAEIRNAGVAMSAVMDLGKIGLYPYAWLNFPSANGTAFVNDTARDLKSGLPGGSLYGAGIESSVELGGYYFRYGGYYANEHYRLFATQASAVSTEDHLMTGLGLYGGCIVYPVDALLLSAAYSCERYHYDDLFPNSTAASSLSGAYAESIHFFVGSCEYTILAKSIVDFFVIRGGLNWSLYHSTYAEAMTESGSLYNFRIEYPDESSVVKPTFGIGIGRKGIHFDIASSLGGWFGLLSGPPVVMGTITLHIDEMRKASR
jgi:hypothetical protein